jgi:peroxiredoxin
MRLSLTVLLCVLLNGSYAAEPSSEEAVKKFEQLQETFQSRKEQYWKSREELGEDSDHLQELYEAKDPANTMAKDFLDLEQQNRGTQVGLSCLHHLVSQGGGIGTSEYPVSTAKQKALVLLREHYANDPDLDVILDWVNFGAFYGAETEKLLEQAAQSPHRHVRGTALFQLAKHMEMRWDVPQYRRSIMSLMTEADAEMWEYQAFKEMEPYFLGIDVEASRQRALELLDEVVANYPDVPKPPRTGYGPILLDIERDSTDAPVQTLGQLAAAMKFQLTHLAIGQIAPDIDQPDAFSKPLRLSDHRGKVTVLFFSYKGCGPCEERYPDNRKLIETMNGRPFAFLGVMGDQQIGTVTDAVENGTITWPVWWAGPDRKLSNQWNVRGWPTIYVMDHTGTIRYINLRGELLRRAVHKLVAEAESAEGNSSP